MIEKLMEIKKKFVQNILQKLLKYYTRFLKIFEKNMNKLIQKLFEIFLFSYSIQITFLNFNKHIIFKSLNPF